MTSSTDTDQHPDVAEISALTEGLLAPDRTAAVRDHLAGCPLCTDVRASLEEIRGLLGTLPGPARMPADIAGRIDAALAAAALLDSTSPVAVSRETGSSVDAQPEPVSRETSVAGKGRAVDRPEGRPRASTGPGRGHGARSRRWVALLGAACALAAIGIGGALLQSVHLSADNSTAAQSDAEKSDRSGDRSAVSTTRLQARVQALVSQAGAAPSGDITSESGPTMPMRGFAPAVPSCVRQGIGRSEAPIAADRERFGGTDAYLVVLPHPPGAARVDAYVVDASCTRTTPSRPGHVLLKHTYPRG